MSTGANNDTGWVPTIMSDKIYLRWSFCTGVDDQTLHPLSLFHYLLLNTTYFSTILFHLHPLWMEGRL